MAGQDLDEGSDGVFRIARRVAKDRVISTVDPEARHGHKTAARGFDGYKGHTAVDPDSEIITATTVSPGNTADGAVAEELIADVLGEDGQDGGQAEAPEEPAAGEVAIAEDVPAGDQRAARRAGWCGPGRGWRRRRRGAGDGLRRQRLRHRRVPRPAGTRPASTPGARASGPPRPAACSPKTTSPATSAPTR